MPTEQNTAGADTLVEWIQVASAGMTDGYQCFFIKDRGHEHFHLSEAPAAAELMRRLSAEGVDVYLRANVQGERHGTTVGTVAAMTMVTIDFDVAGPSHKATNLPKDYSEFDALLVAAEVQQPTMKLRTGGGIAAIWVLDRPLMIQTEEDRQQAISLSRGFQRRLRQTAAARGYHMDATSDLVRAVRLPGTRNWKPAYGSDGVEVTVA